MELTGLVTLAISTLFAVATALQIDSHPSRQLALTIRHDEGFHALSKDGIIRSFAPNKTVLDYVRLSNIGKSLQSLFK